MAEPCASLIQFRYLLQAASSSRPQRSDAQCVRANNPTARTQIPIFVSSTRAIGTFHRRKPVAAVQTPPGPSFFPRRNVPPQGEHVQELAVTAIHRNFRAHDPKPPQPVRGRTNLHNSPVNKPADYELKILQLTGQERRPAKLPGNRARTSDLIRHYCEQISGNKI